METIPLKAEKVELWTTERARVGRRPMVSGNSVIATSLGELIYCGD